MGKIRVKSFGDEELEKKDNKKALARAEAKKAADAARAKAEGPKKAQTTDVQSQNDETAAVDVKVEAKVEKKKVVIKKGEKQKHSASYSKTASLVDKNKKYKLDEALALLEQLKRAKFDETVELHINTHEKGIAGNFNLPHGTGKQMRVEIADQTADAKHVEDLVKAIESGKIEFDVLIATPDSMPKLARVAKVLGPRNLMPNPKNGTVSQTPAEVAKKFEGGQINFKTEAKFPLLHLSIGRISFGEKKLTDNIKTAIQAVKTKNIKTATVKLTMSPGIRLETSSL